MINLSNFKKINIDDFSFTNGNLPTGKLLYNNVKNILISDYGSNLVYPRYLFLNKNGEIHNENGYAGFHPAKSEHHIYAKFNLQAQKEFYLNNIPTSTINFASKTNHLICNFCKNFCKQSCFMRDYCDKNI